ncbi:MAG TPA: hypothetical protein VMU29_02295 [Smithella sp.]|nr:hypothetical protein [Smithella sp.]
MKQIRPLLFRNGSSEEVKDRTTELLAAMKDNPNSLLSSGCDILGTKLGNIDVLFEA